MAKEDPTNAPPSNLPSEESLKALLKVGMVDNVQTILDMYPQHLPYKIVLKEGTHTLVNSVPGAELWLKKFITVDDELLALKDDVMKLSRVDDEVLITGESGTGKELIARALAGDREGSFLRINCAAMPENLLESELFGHKKGSFTGADKDKPGIIEAARGGVLFMDEIGDMPMLLQAKMLNVLQPVDGKRYIRRVGDNDEREVTCRFVFATHQGLKEMMGNGRFRHDLYARISTFELHVKPLRERREDIEPIVREVGRILKIAEEKINEFLAKYREDIINDKVDLSLNVRSLEKAVKRYNLLGKI